MSTIAIILDALKLVFCVVLTYFAFYLYQKEFRPSVMEKGFRMIAISLLLLTTSLIFDLISAIQPDNERSQILRTVLGIAFILVLTYGFYVLYKIWHIDTKNARLAKPIISETVGSSVVNLSDLIEEKARAYSVLTDNAQIHS